MERKKREGGSDRGGRMEEERAARRREQPFGASSIGAVKLLVLLVSRGIRLQLLLIPCIKKN